MRSVEVDGQDVRAVHQTATGLVEWARQGEGPAFLLCHTYRFRGHHVGDVNRGYYRSKEEEQQWQRRDPLKVLEEWLIAEKMADAGDLARIEAEVRQAVAAAVAFAIDAPYPDAAEVDEHVYA